MLPNAARAIAGLISSLINLKSFQWGMPWGIGKDWGISPIVGTSRFHCDLAMTAAMVATTKPTKDPGIE
jgi:hypothetical protein